MHPSTGLYLPLWSRSALLKRTVILAGQARPPFTRFLRRQKLASLHQFLKPFLTARKAFGCSLCLSLPSPSARYAGLPILVLESFLLARRLPTYIRGERKTGKPLDHRQIRTTFGRMLFGRAVGNHIRDTVSAAL
jgi:hypothetical protein